MYDSIVFLIGADFDNVKLDEDDEDEADVPIDPRFVRPPTPPKRKEGEETNVGML